MARRGANLAGLAALGALGYKLAQGKGKTTATGESKASMPTGDDQYDENVKQYMDDTYNPDVKQYMDDTVNPDVKQRTKSSGSPKAPSGPSMMSREKEAKIRETGGPRGTLYLPKSEAKTNATTNDDDLNRIAARYNTKKGLERPKEEPLENLSGDFLPIGRVGKMLGRAAKSAQTALANRASELKDVTFLGKSGARNITEPERIAANKPKRIEYADRSSVSGSTPTSQLPSPARQLSDQRRRVLDESDVTGGAVGYKKGGASKVKKMASGGVAKAAKPAAKGWGQARGARGAKYY